ncbi:MAG: RNA polymerase sigma factor [Alphaproteobacteria bacterium]|nr:RNA polymerase sigma factor [Alphaproteobacteria bacterium]MBU6473946.1 RNA polymerase sigma factor [Alphaproteobacteria bacterium]MDE2013475.1 RNA polymerase sigma factor [Alphaproteobacteria bacterium]MDE2073493.1 RNA polymerase sigma factor [Alphaproteobacteria bacterium]MDE2350852.1 RNA polymerase sigma factor [Alphaproteobacteria bacterium]
MEERGPLNVVSSRADESIEAIRDQMLRLLPRLRRFCIALTGSSADGDDLVQDTVERALKHLHAWEPGTRLDNWMFRIAKNRFVDGRRAARRQGVVAVEAPEEAARAFTDGERLAESRLALKAVNAALQDLPPEQRQAVILVLVEGVSYRDAADILNIPIGTVTSRISRARAALVAATGS